MIKAESARWSTVTIPAETDENAIILRRVDRENGTTSICDELSAMAEGAFYVQRSMDRRNSIYHGTPPAYPASTPRSINTLSEAWLVERFLIAGGKLAPDQDLVGDEGGEEALEEVTDLVVRVCGSSPEGRRAESRTGLSLTCTPLRA